MMQLIYADIKCNADALTELNEMIIMTFYSVFTTLGLEFLEKVYKNDTFIKPELCNRISSREFKWRSQILIWEKSKLS
jgi:hypothetical protein